MELNIVIVVGLTDPTGARKHAKPTARGFEPLRAEPNGFLVHHLNHSVTLSCLASHAPTHVGGFLTFCLLFVVQSLHTHPPPELEIPGPSSEQDQIELTPLRV